MFKENFERLCNIKGKSPSSVCRELGLSSAAYSKWTSNTVPHRATLLKTADYFNVSPESLITGDSQTQTTPTPLIDERGTEFIRKISQLSDVDLYALSTYLDYLIAKRKNKTDNA